MRLAYILLPVLNVITVSSHMAMYQPCPRYSKYDSKCPDPPPGFTVDYNIKDPISTKDQIFAPLCKYTTPYTSPTENWTAGQDITVKFQPGGASHGGGHCQFALSYDGGKSFVVIYDVKRYCFMNGPENTNHMGVGEYTFPLPHAVPSGKNVIFAWTWINAVGNREYYMNCADVTIESKSSSFVGPELLIANYGPSYPVVGEFNGNYEMGIDLLDDRKIITVSSSGQTASPSSTARPSSTPPTASYTSSSAPIPSISSTSTSKPPTSTASTSKLPTSTASTSKLPTSTASTSKLPTSIPSTSKPSTTKTSTSMTPTSAPITSKPTTSTKTSSSTSSQTNTPSSCIVGQMKCDDNNPFIYYVCEFKEFVPRPVAQGTKCASIEGGIVLVMA